MAVGEESKWREEQQKWTLQLRDSFAPGGACWRFGAGFPPLKRVGNFRVFLRDRTLPEGRSAKCEERGNWWPIGIFAALWLAATFFHRFAMSEGGFFAEGGRRQHLL